MASAAARPSRQRSGASRDLRKSCEAVLAEGQRSAGAVNDASSWGWVVLAFLVMALIGGCFITTWLARSVIIPLNPLANLLGRAGRWAAITDPPCCRC
jgi:hypothetical protein